MTNRFDVLTQQLFQKNIDDCSVDELQDLAREYPYFAPAQYALLSKLKHTDQPAYQVQLQKAILYYPDPHTFDQFINSEKYEIEFFETEKVVEIENDLTDEIQEEVPLHEGALTTTEPATAIEIKNELQEEDVEILHEEEADSITATGIDENVEIEQEAAPAITEQPTEMEPAGEEKIIPLQDTNSSSENISEPDTGEKISADESIIMNKAISQVLDREERMLNEEKPLVEINAQIKEKDPVTDQLVFEPYHTVDYFASQGIKLSVEEASRDKFGKQLKSFTEWLKTMKKFPVSEQVKPMDVKAEQKVENLAAHSVETEEVYTETMAEVWLKQGNPEKAIETYNKLSLLNPSKRTYFAAKIDSLK